MKDLDPTSNFWKAREADLTTTIPEGKILGLRLDGRAFHTFTKSFKRPFDSTIVEAMDSAMEAVVLSVFPHALLAFTQSDEITVFVDFREKHEMDFSGKIQKLVSMSAAAATLGFNRKITKLTGEDIGFPIFDSRVFTCDTLEEVLSNLNWRRLDSRKNAITMAAHAVHGHKALKGIPTRERLDMLKGTEWEHIPEGFMWGRMLLPEVKMEMVTFIDKRTDEEITKEALRRTWHKTPATRDVVEDHFRKLGAEV